MRHLLLLRHAKAVISSADGDFGRELAPRGVRQATRFGQWLAAQPFSPNLAIASPARRTRETTNLVLAALSVPPQRIDERALYNADPAEILAIGRGAGPEARSLMLVGHNPGIADLATLLAVNDATPAWRNLARNYPTCSCAILDFDIDDWSDLAPSRGKLAFFVTPKTLDASEIDD
jgi:phosphohistidine phosphatase